MTNVTIINDLAIQGNPTRPVATSARISIDDGAFVGNLAGITDAQSAFAIVDGLSGGGNLTGAITSVGTATSLGSFSSANLSGALTDETGTGSAVFATAPTLTNPVVGTQAISDNSTKAASTGYVMSVLAAFNPQLSVFAATATALPANTYSNGSSGVGATLTATGNGVLTIDGFSIGNGQRVLIKNEAAPANNGVYLVTSIGSVSTPYVLTRANNFNSTSNITETGVIAVFNNGTVNAKFQFICTSVVVTVGTTAINFIQSNPPSAPVGFSGPISPISTFPQDSNGLLFPNFYSGSGGNASPYDQGLGVAGSIGSDATWGLRFPMPPTIPSGTLKLRLLCLANATSGVVKLTVSDGVCAAGSSPSAVSLTSETQTTLTWGAGDNDKYKEAKISLTATPSANNMLVVALTFNTTGYTLAQVLTVIPTIIWE